MRPAPLLFCLTGRPRAKPDRVVLPVIYTSSFFGDELWPSDSLGSVRSALVAAPSPVCIVYVSALPGSAARRRPLVAAPGDLLLALPWWPRLSWLHLCFGCPAWEASMQQSQERCSVGPGQQQAHQRQLRSCELPSAHCCAECGCSQPVVSE